jgi:hypothetical protein
MRRFRQFEGDRRGLGQRVGMSPDARSARSGGHTVQNVRHDYIEQLRRKGPVACDDGTAIGELGVP